MTDKSMNDMLVLNELIVKHLDTGPMLEVSEKLRGVIIHAFTCGFTAGLLHRDGSINYDKLMEEV